MQENKTLVLKMEIEPSGDGVVYINSELKEEAVLTGYTMLTHALTIALASKYEAKYDGDTDKAIAEALGKVALAADLAHEYSEFLSEEAEVTR